MLARCPSCRNTFSAQRAGRQVCPVCGKPLVIPETPAELLPQAPEAELLEEPSGTPWERRAELGFVRGWAATMQLAFFEPGRLFAMARLDQGRAQLSFALFTISVFWAIGQVFERALAGTQHEQMKRLIGSISSNPDVSPMLKRMIDAQERVSSPAWFIGLVLLTPAFSYLLIYLNAGVTHAFAVLMGQAKRGFPATFAACAYGCAPLVLLAVPACGSVVGALWLVVLTGVGLKITHRISTGGAAAAVLAPYAIFCCLGMLAAAAMAMSLRGALGQ